MITNSSELDPKGSYTYADYQKWRFEESVELYVYERVDGQYVQREVYEQSGVAASVVFPQIKVDIEWIFGD